MCVHLGDGDPWNDEGLERRARIASWVADPAVPVHLSRTGLRSPRPLDGQGVVVDRVVRVELYHPQLRGLRSADDDSADRRRTRPRDPGRAWPAAGCARRRLSCGRRSSAGSPSTTRSCSPRCSPASTNSAPTSQTWKERTNAQIAPAVARLDEIPGIGVTAAQASIAEIGLDMTRFPTPRCPPGAGSRQGSRSPPAARKATAPPGTATPT